MGALDRRVDYAGFEDERNTTAREAEIDDMTQLRAARLAELKQEKEWREAGHGELRELADEVEFLEVMEPRERGVLLISDRANSAASEQILQIMEELARLHVEAQFCFLELENAGMLAHAVALDEGVPVVLALKRGVVSATLPPSQLFSKASASSPKFRRHFIVLLQRAGCIDLDVKAEDSESD